MCEDDLVPDDGTPRLRKLADGMAASGRKGRCKDCPKHDRGRRWCPVRAESRTTASPMCKYGRALLSRMKSLAGQAGACAAGEQEGEQR